MRRFRSDDFPYTRLWCPSFDLCIGDISSLSTVQYSAKLRNFKSFYLTTQIIVASNSDLFHVNPDVKQQQWCKFSLNFGVLLNYYTWIKNIEMVICLINQELSIGAISISVEPLSIYSLNHVLLLRLNNLLFFVQRLNSMFDPQHISLSIISILDIWNSNKSTLNNVYV